MEDLIRQDRPQDPKRWALIRGTQAVMVGFLTLCGAAAYQIFKSQDHDIHQGVATVLISLAALLITGTVVAHHKPDDPLPLGDQP